MNCNYSRYIMQAEVYFNCLGNKCLSYAKPMRTALTQLLVFRFPCLLTNKRDNCKVIITQINLYKQ